MRQNKFITETEQQYLKKRPKFAIGDTLKVSLRIIEGEKERIQQFTGIVIAKKGSGLSTTFTLYRNAYGCNMQRVFLLHSPRIGKIEIERTGKVRKSKLYYLRGKEGKASKVEEKMGIVSEKETTQES